MLAGLGAGGAGGAGDFSSNGGNGSSGGGGSQGGTIRLNAGLTSQAAVALNAGSIGAGGAGGQGGAALSELTGGNNYPAGSPGTAGNAGSNGTKSNITGTAIDVTAGTSLSVNSDIVAISGGVNLIATTGISNSANGINGLVTIAGASAVTLSNATSGLVNIDAGTAPVTVLAAGIGSSSTRIVTTGDIILQGAISATAAGDAIRLAAGRNFINNAGANALTVAGGGRYLVWSQTPVSDTFDGLVSGNTALWSTAYSPANPTVTGAGNQFVFSNARPTTIGIVKADNQSKTYGDAFTAPLTYTAYVADTGVAYDNAFSDAGSGKLTLAGNTPLLSEPGRGSVATATRTGEFAVAPPTTST